jgi:sugar (pentulose or hexulose) kinase
VIRLAGGGSRHPAWRQLLADALFVPLVPAAGPLAGETGWLTARGAALLAAAAAGLVPPAATAAGSTTAGSTAAGSTAEEGTVRPASPLAEAGYRRFRSVASQPGR